MNVRQLINEIFSESRLKDTDSNLGLVYAIMKTEARQMAALYRWRSLYREVELNPDPGNDFRVSTNFQHILDDMVWWTSFSDTDTPVALRRIDYIAAGQFDSGTNPFAYRTMSTTNEQETVTYVYPFPNGNMNEDDVVKVNGYIYPSLALDGILNPISLADAIRLASIARIMLMEGKMDAAGPYSSLAKKALINAQAAEPTTQIQE